MDIKTIALVIFGLWAFKRLGHAHEVAITKTEIVPVDPYMGVGSLWDTLNTADYGYNAHPPTLAVIGGNQTLAAPCMCN